jgi:hypothetical protein
LSRCSRFTASLFSALAAAGCFGFLAATVAVALAAIASSFLPKTGSRPATLAEASAFDLGTIGLTGTASEAPDAAEKAIARPFFPARGRCPQRSSEFTASARFKRLL